MQSKFNPKPIIKKGLISTFILLLLTAIWLAFLTPPPEEKTLYEFPDFYNKSDANYLENWPENIAPKLNPITENFIDELITKLTLEEKVAQMILLPGSMSATNYNRYPFSGKVFDSSFNSRSKGKLRSWLKEIDKIYNGQKDFAQENQRPFIPPFLRLDIHNGLTNNNYFLPSRLNLGQSQSPALTEQLALAQAKQVAQTGFNWMLDGYDSPIHDKRLAQISASFSEDPTVNKLLSSAYIKGAQFQEQETTYVMATSRGYLASGAASFTRGNIFEDESVLLNRYAPGHFGAIEQGVLSIEVSNGQINSKDMLKSRYYIQEILKDKLGFKGLVTSPVNASAQVFGCRLASCVQAINAGVDLFYFNSEVSISAGVASYAATRYDASEKFIIETINSVNAGEITIERINDAVRRILRAKHQLGLFDYQSPSERAKIIEINDQEMKALAKQSVKQSAVILKNTNNTLPLDKRYKVLLTGLGANEIPYQLGFWYNNSPSQLSSFNNNLIRKWSSLNKSFKDNQIGAQYDFIPFEYIDANAITQKALSQHLKREDGVMIPKKNRKGIYGELEELNSELDTKIETYQANYIKRIKQATKHYKQIVMVISQAPVSNNRQREVNLDFAQHYKNQVEAFKLLQSLDSSITVIFYGHAPMYMPEIMDKANAIIFAGQPGSDVTGLLDVLYNEDIQNFAKLPFSWPRQPCGFKQSLGVFEYDPFLAFGFGNQSYVNSTSWKSATPEDLEYCSAIKR